MAGGGGDARLASRAMCQAPHCRCLLICMLTYADACSTYADCMLKYADACSTLQMPANTTMYYIYSIYIVYAIYILLYTIHITIYSISICPHTSLCLILLSVCSTCIPSNVSHIYTAGAYIYNCILIFTCPHTSLGLILLSAGYAYTHTHTHTHTLTHTYVLILVYVSYYH